jgi:hypothetical protein
MYVHVHFTTFHLWEYQPKFWSSFPNKLSQLVAILLVFKKCIIFRKKILLNFEVLNQHEHVVHRTSI